MAGVSWDQSHFAHFLGENDGKQMDLSLSAQAGTGASDGSVWEWFGIYSRLPEACLQRWLYNLAISSG